MAGTGPAMTAVSIFGNWYHLYYPSRRQLAPAFAALVEALRYRPAAHET
jgi:hypothetical protein